MTLPMPEDEYLLAIGRLAYAVGYAEGIILFDLDRMTGLPPAFRLSSLVGSTTGGIGRSLQEETNLRRVGDVELRNYLRDVGAHLCAIAALRDAVLHARPATIDERQRLYRWYPRRGEVFMVDLPYLEQSFADIERRVSVIAERRSALGLP